MRTMMVRFRSVLILISISITLTGAYPIESKPLNNNPETWDLGEGWMLFNPLDSSDPSAAALIASDTHVKKSKITPKSIFIAPNAVNHQIQECPHGFRIDDNGKCIKTVTINQDKILAARISELFGVSDNPNKNSDIDSDYYDFDDESKSDKDSGPLQFNIPLSIDFKEDSDGEKVEYIIQENFNMRNFNPKDFIPTTVESSETTTSEEMATTTALVPVTEVTEAVSTEEPVTTTEVSTEFTTEEDELSTTVEVMTTTPPSTSTTTTTTTTTPPPTSTTQETTSTTKIFSVDFLPKRKPPRSGQQSARLKNARDREKFVERPRKQKTTALSTKSGEKSSTKLFKLDNKSAPKKNRTRSGSKRPGQRRLSTTTELVTETPVTTAKPFWWLPRGIAIDESKEKPVLVRFWQEQPLPHDERARSHSARQRVNSRMPSDNIFREITAPELESVLRK